MRRFRRSLLASAIACLVCASAGAQTPGPAPDFAFSVEGVRQYLSADQQPVSPAELEAVRANAALASARLRVAFVTEKIVKIDIAAGTVLLANGKERAVKPAESQALLAALAGQTAWMDLQRKILIHDLSPQIRADLLGALEQAAQAQLDPRKAVRGENGWMIDGRLATEAEGVIADRYAAASGAALAEYSARAAGKADVRLVGDAALAGRSGSGAPSPSPFFSQTVEFNRGARLIDPFKVQYGALYAMKLDAGEPMFWIGDAVCTDKHNFMEVKCFRDTDADGRMETSYFAGYAPNLVLVLGSVGYREKAPSQAFRVETSTVADRFRHAIGIAATGIRIDKASGAASVQLAVFLRNTSEPRWTWEEMRGQEQTLVIPKGGKGVYEMLGARIEIEPAGPKSFNWKILKPFPEQPLDGSTAVTGSTYFGAGVPMLRVEARAAATPMPSVLPPLRSGSR